MIDRTFYLSDSDVVDEALEITGLAIDELEAIVGRFKSDHFRWPNQLKGELVLMLDGEAKIRHHFTKKVIWSNL